ncbi:MAG: hypothetical protein ACFE9L_00225 [Candidatus Hodarchaeota archaeon]
MKNQGNNKTIKPRKLFTMKLTLEERGQYDDLAEIHGFSTLAGLIRSCLQAAIRDPTILNPTIDPKPKD